MRYLEEYLHYLKYEKNYSPRTIDSYEIDIVEFIDFCDENNTNIVNVKYNDVSKYLRTIDNKEKATTLARKISSLRGFYNYLISVGYIENNPCALVRTPKKEKTPLGQRDRLILEVLYASGVRVSELVNIKISDISNMDIRILGKGSKERIAHIGEYAKEILDLYLKDGYNTLNKKSSEYLFLNNNGGKLSVRGVRFLLYNIIKKTTINKKISTHMLRLSFSTHLLNEGCDILSVQELLGHESLSATAIYTHVTTDKLKEVYFNSHPRAKMK